MKQQRGASSLSQLSQRFGYSRDWLSATKWNDPKKLEWFFSFDDDRATSIAKCQEYIEQLVLDVQAIFYEFEVPSHFHQWCINVQVLPEDKSVQNGYALERLIFNMSKPLSRALKVIRKFEKIRDCWERKI